jgi:hypothetical protein
MNGPSTLDGKDKLNWPSAAVTKQPSPSTFVSLEALLPTATVTAAPREPSGLSL